MRESQKIVILYLCAEFWEKLTLVRKRLVVHDMPMKHIHLVHLHSVLTQTNTHTPMNVLLFHV